MTEMQTILPLAAAITALGGAWLTIRKIAKDIEKSKKDQEESFLRMAKQEDELMRVKLEGKIEDLKTELGNLESSVNKDIEHLKDTYNGEIRNLGQKIEELRSELKNQHGQLVQLLTEMIKKKS